MIKELSLVCLCSLGAAACSRMILGRPDGGAKGEMRSYPAGVDGLQAFVEDVLAAARKDDRDRVHDLLASTILPDGDLSALLGPATAGRLLPRYHSLMETLVNRGAIELVAQVYERKYDTVEVIAIDAKNASAEDRAVMAALREPTPIYSVRIRKASETKGLRYDFFFYRNGHWYTGNQLGKYLVPEPQKLPDGGTRR
jgi:hypothetical protein